MLTLLYHDTVSCFSAELVGKNMQDHNNVDRFKWNTDSYMDLSEGSILPSINKSMTIIKIVAFYVFQFNVICVKTVTLLSIMRWKHITLSTISSCFPTTIVLVILITTFVLF